METAVASTPLAASFGGESAPSGFEDDARHFAVAAGQSPKPTAGLPLTLSPTHDFKGVGTRFCEECKEIELPTARACSSRVTSGKGKAAVVPDGGQKPPLHLLDLPVDILKEIVKEVTHTNDLTSLALCHSALHRLAIPHIYSRFDIVWPDTNAHHETRSGVDALTYGLATLVMAEEIFGEAPNQRRGRSGPTGRASEATVRRRRGNHYAQFTRKFSLGNGPADWVHEYLITKESGKMLGTLVALAVARMRSLETFIWDMPTGILRDVWLALSSLGDGDDPQPCKLEKVWVRWHDNSSSDIANPIPPPPPPPPPPIGMDMATVSPPSFRIHPAALDRVEHPSFSVLPPLKSLSVLDIDELPYLDEMAVLIGNSAEKLRELRVGIARHATSRKWTAIGEVQGLLQVDPGCPTGGSLTIGDQRLHGVLGILTGFVCDMRRPIITLPDRTRRRDDSRTMPAKANQVNTQATPPRANESQPQFPNDGQSFLQPDDAGLQDVLPAEVRLPNAQPPLPQPVVSEEGHTHLAPQRDPRDDALVAISADTSPEPPRSSVHSSVLGTTNAMAQDDVDRSGQPDEFSDVHLDRILRLENLELERVRLSVPVLQRALDWSLITSLTLLDCANHEQLWKTLRRAFAPTVRSPSYSHARRSPNATPRKGGRVTTAPSDLELEYTLNLKRVHTNNVSAALITFLRETIAPNSLEVLFLQEARNYNSAISVDNIFKGPLRRHRSSLKKVLVDSSERSSDGSPASSSRWRKWMFTREILAFACSGKMPALRELGMAIDYRDWHFFVQNLPSMPRLSSLYIPFIADHVHGPNVDPRDLAMQIVSAVHFKPEIEICYVGIANKCFEILEPRPEWDARPESHLGFPGDASGDPAGSDGDDEVDDDDGDDSAEDDNEGDVVDDGDGQDAPSDDDEEDGDLDSELDGTYGARTARPRLREILFYDDKVAVFKARHGRL